MVSVRVWVEDHPYLTGFTVLALLVLIFILWRRRQTAAATVPDQAGSAYYAGPSEGLQVAQLQAGAQTQGQILAAQVQQAGIEADLQKSYYAGQAQLYSLDAAREVADRQTDAELTLGLFQTAGQVATSGAQAQFGSTIFGATDLSLAQRNAALQQQMQAAGAVAAAAAIPSAAPGVPTVAGAGMGAGSLSPSTLPYAGMPGQVVHGVTETYCSGLPLAQQADCARANQAAINTSYDQASGSYLGNGVYAGTQAAFQAYGDPTDYSSMQQEYLSVCGGPVCQFDANGNIVRAA
jgi:hypothetical protein